VKHASRAIALSVVIACTVGTMAFGVAAKAPCANGDWAGDPQYRYWCYTDIVPLIATEQLEGGRLPFLDACVASDHNCDEYPVLSMYVMRAAAWAANLAPGEGPRYAAFYFVNAAILAAAAVAIAASLWALVGRRALWFALAPTLLLTGTVNWDLVAVALATAAFVAFAARREEWSGVAIGLGAATKFYPSFLMIPLFAQGLHDRQPDRSVRVLWWSVGAWLAVNLPFIIAAPRGWIEFFRFNSERAADFDSLWYIAADLWPRATLPIRVVNVASMLLFVAGVALCWWLKARVPGRLQPWTLAFPFLVVFLLVNKVYSPQYGLWLVPLFALCVPSFRVFALFQVADVAVFLTRFRFFGTYVGEPWGWPASWFRAALLFRAAVLVGALVLWIRTVDEPLLLRTSRSRDPVPADPTPATEAAPA